jgi:GTP-binding protein Era
MTDTSPHAIRPEDRRCAFVAVIGAPNAGKSTLVNAVVGTKVTIVSHKVQTTRMPVRGIAMSGASQLVFIDTPGIFKPKRRLDRAMVDAAWSGARDADIVVLLFDASRALDAETKAMIARVPAAARTILALNKVDRVKKEKLLELAAAFAAERSFDATYMISALNGSGLQALVADLAKHAPLGDWHFPPEDVSDLPMRILAAEITREKIYDRLHEELPYATTVETTAWQDKGAGGVRIEQTIYVARENQRPIVLGAGGQTIKALSIAARKELAEIVGRPVHLFLMVKVKDGWEHDRAHYREMGLTYPED